MKQIIPAVAILAGFAIVGCGTHTARPIVAPTDAPTVAAVVAVATTIPSAQPFTNIATRTNLRSCPRGFYAYVIPVMADGEGPSTFYCSPLTVAEGGNHYNGGGYVWPTP